MDANRPNKRKWFCIKKTRSSLYPAKSMTDANYAYDLTLLTNTFAQTKSLLYSQKQPTGVIGLYVDTYKT